LGAQDGLHEKPKAKRAATQMIDVSITDNKFEPAVQTIKSSQAIKWTNHGDGAHTATSKILDGKGGAFHSADIYPGQYVVINFNTPGVYEYRCIYDDSMKGTIKVTE
jgi:plastocyanin